MAIAEAHKERTKAAVAVRAVGTSDTEPGSGTLQ
jgi:hypothetical protein